MSTRSILRNTFLSIAGQYSKPAPGIHILNGHRTIEECEPETFRDMIRELSKQVKFVNIDEAVQMIINHERPTESVVAFTFDDGFEECYTIFAPVLETVGVNALFFVNPNYVEGDESYIKHFNEVTVRTIGKRPMRWEYLKKLRDRGFIIGAHTMDHYLTAKEDERELKYQIVECKKVIEENLGVSCDYFAWPYGKIEHTSQKAVELACDTYKYVFSQSDYKHYFSFNGRVINRRHFEPFWPVSHVKYFLSCKKK